MRITQLCFVFIVLCLIVLFVFVLYLASNVACVSGLSIPDRSFKFFLTFIRLFSSSILIFSIKHE